jgi:hypothetical protein
MKEHDASGNRTHVANIFLPAAAGRLPFRLKMS